MGRASSEQRASQRDVAVPPLGALDALGERRLERVDQHRARPRRTNDVVDVAALGGGERVRELRLVVVDQLDAPRDGVVGLGQLRCGRRC